MPESSAQPAILKGLARKKASSGQNGAKTVHALVSRSTRLFVTFMTQRSYGDIQQAHAESKHALDQGKSLNRKRPVINSSSASCCCQ